MESSAGGTNLIVADIALSPVMVSLLLDVGQTKWPSRITEAFRSQSFRVSVFFSIGPSASARTVCRWILGKSKILRPLNKVQKPGRLVTGGPERDLSER